MSNQKKLGALGESLVADYLEKEQFTIIAKNFRRRDGEVDIIAQKNRLIVFVEVKTRTSQRIDPAEIITQSKQRKIGLAAGYFITEMSKKQADDVHYRFDVAIIEYKSTAQNITYIPNAFQVDEYV